MALWITEDDIRQLMDMPQAIDVVEEAFKSLSNGAVSMPQRAGFAITGYGGGAAMPAYVGGAVNGLAVKVVTACGANPARFNLPVVMATVLLLDFRSGRLLAVMDGAYLTALRTGAVSGVATKYLAGNDAQRLLLFGAGVQGVQQAKAVCRVRAINHIDVVEKNPYKIENLRKIFSMNGKINVKAVNDLQKAVAAADIIATATTSSEPLFKGEWLREGVHINAIGAHAPTVRELDGATIRRAMIVADQRAACLTEAGDILLAIEEGAVKRESAISAELGELITGKHPGRPSQKTITCFKSVGLAIQDTAVAQAIYRTALANNAGQKLK